MTTYMITGGAGFIGSNFVDMVLKKGPAKIVVVDLLTYAGNLKNLEQAMPQIEFVKADIQDTEKMSWILSHYGVDRLVNFAAESHVDRSIDNASAFIDTNVVGVHSLLSAATRYWSQLPTAKKTDFRFLQISTDEVFGSLGSTGFFSESTSYAPNSPYSASKAAGDHLVRAWHHTYGLPVIITNCSNNYGPRQYPEKLIPHMIVQALSNKALPVYGTGENIRDWIHVEDHCEGIFLALERGRPGSSYCFGGNSERKNLDVVNAICHALDLKFPDKAPHSQLIKYVEDRKGHDWRYAIDDSLAQKELGFKRRYGSFDDGLKSTVEWYLHNSEWLASLPRA